MLRELEFRIERLDLDERDLFALKPLWEANLGYHRTILQKTLGERGFFRLESELDWAEYISWLTVGSLADNIVCYLAMVRSRPAGYSVGQLITPPQFFGGRVGYINELFVQEEYRNKGVGGALLQSLGKWFQYKGAYRIEAQYYLGNQAAELFWAKKGYTPLARRIVRNLEEEGDGRNGES
jgi:GNAT superfamily N-acetyltransferase